MMSEILEELNEIVKFREVKSKVLSALDNTDWDETEMVRVPLPNPASFNIHLIEYRMEKNPVTNTIDLVIVRHSDEFILTKPKKE